MCTSYELKYLHCKRDIKRECNHADFFPCESGMCKGKDYQWISLDMEERCPIHKRDEEMKVKAKRHESKKMEEWPETICGPM